eukprot:g3051.t1
MFFRSTRSKVSTTSKLGLDTSLEQLTKAEQSQNLYPSLCVQCARMNCACDLVKYACAQCVDEPAPKGPSKPREVYAEAEREQDRAEKEEDKRKQMGELQNLAVKVAAANEKKRAKNAENIADQLYSPLYPNAVQETKKFDETVSENDEALARQKADTIAELEDKIGNEISNLESGKTLAKSNGENVGGVGDSSEKKSGEKVKAIPSAGCDMPPARMTDEIAVRCLGRHLDGRPANPLFDYGTKYDHSGLASILPNASLVLASGKLVLASGKNSFCIPSTKIQAMKNDKSHIGKGTKTKDDEYRKWLRRCKILGVGKEGKSKCVKNEGKWPNASEGNCILSSRIDMPSAEETTPFPPDITMEENLHKSKKNDEKMIRPAPTEQELQSKCPTEYEACKSDVTCVHEMNDSLYHGNGPPVNGSKLVMNLAACFALREIAGDGNVKASLRGSFN